MLEHSAARHVDYLRQCLRQDKAAIGFLLSAGCGVAIEASGAPSIPDIAGMTAKISGSLADSEQGTAFAALLATFDGSSPNIEALLSRTRALAAVAGVGPVHGLDALALETTGRHDQRRNRQARRRRFPSRRTLSSAASQPGPTARRHDRRRWSDSLTNYDLLLFEQALERVGVPASDGFVGSHRPFFDATALYRAQLPTRWLRLWKLHGSINWCRGSDGGVYRTFPGAETFTDPYPPVAPEVRREPQDALPRHD